MNNLKKPLFVFVITLSLVTASVYGQEFKYEIGGAAGISSYMGDANKSGFVLHQDIAAGLLFRYNINFHWALKANLLGGSVKGNTEESGSSFPYGQQTAFRRSFTEAGAQLEFNFLPYSDKYGYTGTKPYTPYLFLGAGITYAPGEIIYTGMNMPFGVGFKYKLKNRINIAIESSMRKLFSDDFDVTRKEHEWNLNQPYGIRSSLFKNRDWYSITMICLTWDFGLREDPCHGN